MRSERVVRKGIPPVVALERGGRSRSARSATADADALASRLSRAGRERLTNYGPAQDDVSTSSTFKLSKGCTTDALKRASVQWDSALPPRATSSRCPPCGSCWTPPARCLRRCCRSEPVLPLTSTTSLASVSGTTQRGVPPVHPECPRWH
jgi:hypothetical protein